MLRLLKIGLIILPGLAWTQSLHAVSEQSLDGSWYNADYGIYPSFAVLSFSAGGTVHIAGLDGRRRSGRYEMGAEGRLVIRMPEDTEPFALKIIIDSVPVLQGEQLQLQARQRTFSFSRATWLKAEIEQATARFRPPKPKPAPARRKPDKPTTEPGTDTAQTQAVAAPTTIKRLLVNLSGDGAGPEGCDGPVVDSLRELGWQIVEQTSGADAIVEIELSGIENKRSFWVGRYYKINYRITLKRASGGQLLGSVEGTERASGDGWFEVCTDVADDIAGEVEDLIEDAEDD